MSGKKHRGVRKTDIFSALMQNANLGNKKKNGLAEVERWRSDEESEKKMEWKTGNQFFSTQLSK